MDSKDRLTLSLAALPCAERETPGALVAAIEDESISRETSLALLSDPAPVINGDDHDFAGTFAALRRLPLQRGGPMAPRYFWKGYLKFSLVTCAVTMSPALTASEKVRFHTLNARTGNRVISQYVDAETGDLVGEDDEARGYPRGEDEYVILEDEELDAVALESTRTIDIDLFAPAQSVDWIWYDRPHFLTPADKLGVEAFSVIRDAMEATGTAGVARLVLYRRERAVMLKPRDRGIILWTLRYGDEVRGGAERADVLSSEKPDKEALRLFSRLVGQRTTDWSPDMTRDPVQDRLRDIIEARRKKGKPARRRKAPEAGPQSNVISIMDALRKSIRSEGSGKGRQASGPGPRKPG